MLVADIFERKSKIVERLRELGACVEVQALRVADYAAGTTLVERKSVLDFHVSIIKGRLWPQVGRLRQACGTPYLLLEGCDIDAGPLHPNSIRGACLVLAELGIRTLRTTDQDDSALWLFLLANRLQKRPRAGGRPAYAQRPKGSRDAAEAMLAAVPGISTRCARSLLDRFGSLAAVLAANQSDWLSVPGIGPKRASALAQTLAHDRRLASRSPRRGERPGPST